MKTTVGMTKTIDDRLKVCYWDSATKKVYCQRKRTKFKSEAVKRIQAEYVKTTVHAVKYIKDIYGLSLRDCMNIVNYLRGNDYFEARYLSQFN